VPWIEISAEALFIVPLSLASLAWGATRAASPCPSSWCLFLHECEQVAGMAAFVGGTYLNLAPEWQRHVWKQLPANQGKLYTEGWFGVARHINYSGEICSFVGFAIATGQWWNQWIPLAMALGMCCWSAPELDWYLKNRYGPEAYNKWCDEVPYLFIPGVW
jgi:steroid 5-alpha reductase family enzyme